MVTIDKKLGGLIPYRTVFFPGASALARALDSLKPHQIARFFWTGAKLDHSRFVVGHQTSTTICIEAQRPLDAILKDMSQSTRRKLRQAEMLSDRVRIVRNGPDASRDFLALYNNFVRSKRTGVSPISESLLRLYAASSDIFLLYLDGAALCGHLNLLDAEAGRERLLFSASRRFDDPETARLCSLLNCHLHWHELRSYREEGLSTYDLGGFSNGANTGLDRFKASFGGQLLEEHTYLCAGSPRVARGLLRLCASFGMLRRLTNGVDDRRP
ncbi:MAG TPA: GNAT family N-acetyltransferase [Candidatus Binataceae bacterium]|nr:GNAT family N-acetyltransferase [Candidatus Binataceae bacterium]